jgi:hypothetical protein
MSTINKELVEIPLTTIDFYKYEDDGIVYYEFDARECTPPEPMVNTINALKILKNSNEKLRGYFFHEPFPLYERIATHFSYEAQALENGDFLVTFGLLDK